MVLYIDGNYPLHSLHGELVTSLAELGNEITVFVPMKGVELKGKYDCNHPKIKVLYSDILNNPDRLFFVQKIHKIASEVEKAVDFSKVDCILAGTVYSDGGVAYLLHKKYHVPFSVAVRETDVTYHMKWRPYLNSFVQGILGEASRIIFLSPSYRKYLERFGCNQNKYINIPNAVNDYWFLDQRKSRNIHMPVSLIFVGEICKRKNVASIISAMALLRKRGMETCLDLVGSGKEEENCRALAEKLGISDKVHFHGWMDSKEKIKSFYDCADIFVMPSFRETFGTVYVEALSQGLPVVYTRGQGIDGYFDPGEVGYACDPEKPDEIAWAIQSITEKYESISLTCIVASTRFQWKTIAEQYNNVINEMRSR